MITVKEAKDIIEKNTSMIVDSEMVAIKDAHRRRIAENILSDLDLPPFNQSNVDGYAICGTESHKWNVIDEIKAGDNCTIQLKNGEAVRVFTGAMVPANAYCVIMQELVERNVNSISTTKEFSQGEHIRLKGSQIHVGEKAIEKGTFLQASSIGFLASLGVNTIKVFKQPVIKLIITGNELNEPGSELEQGKVFESNSFSLSSALKDLHLEFSDIAFIKDDKQSLYEAVKKMLLGCDLLVISGGISVGDYDFVNEVLQQNNTETLFYKISQKPGKPLFFGKHRKTLVFALPGNPASALTCFYEYIYPCLNQMIGHTEKSLPSLMLPSKTEIKKKSGLSNFLKARVENNSVLCLDGQESYKIRSFAEANAFIYLPLEKETVSVGELVEVHLLP